jgi:hypothetical protein
MMLDEDADFRSHLETLGPGALAELRRVLQAPTGYSTEVLRTLTGRPAYADLATLFAMTDTDEGRPAAAAAGDSRSRRLGRQALRDRLVS